MAVGVMGARENGTRPSIIKADLSRTRLPRAQAIQAVNEDYTTPDTHT